MGKTLDLAGKIIGCIKVLEFDHIERHGSRKVTFRYWKVVCLNCGNITLRETGHINKTMACRNCRQLPKGHAGARRLFDIYKRHAKTNDREFSLSLEKFIELTSSKCYYCGSEPKQVIFNNAEKPNRISTWGHYTYNGLDRVDNNRGYTDDNVAPCCGLCNWAKQDRTSDELKQYILNIYKNAMEGAIPFMRDETHVVDLKGQPGVPA